MNNGKDNSYGSVKEQSLALDKEISTPVQDTLRSKKHSVNAIAAAFTLFGLFVVFGQSRSSRTNITANANILLAKANAQGLNLPSYITALDKTDPEWDDYAYQLTSKWVIGDPGNGNLIPDEVALVKFVKPHFVFRTYGGEGKASQCGYWWVMNPPTGDKDSYFDHFAICPEWDDATDIIRCRVPVGYIAVVGAGQTLDCPDSGSHLTPDFSDLQLNGDICTASVKMEKHLSCEYCASNTFDLAKSSCANKGGSYIDGFEFST